LAHKRRRVVLVSAPGLVQKATESTLASCAEVDLVATVSGALSATGVLPQMQPDLVLIDATLAEEEVEALLEWIKGHCPGVQCAAMTVTSHQRDLVLGWGADVAIHRAGLAGYLRQILGCLPTQVAASVAGNGG
jgi:DNA-binding NarL/FixJ family response regulator